MPVIQLDEVSRTYPEGDHLIHAVDGISLRIHRGEFSVLAGPSGSGKTTLLNLIGGIDQPSSGQVSIDGQVTSGRSQSQLTKLRLEKIGFVFQSYNLLPVLTVKENIQLILQIKGIPDKTHQAVLDPLLDELGLTDLGNRFPSQLSGGQQQRVAVARAVIGEPTIVLADEPTANLDSDSAHTLLAMMKRLNETRKVTFLFSSHDSLVIAEARRVIRLRDGKIHEDSAL